MKRIFILILFFYSLTNFAQKLVHTTLSIQDGLPSSYITQILQDNEKYIWISTNNGLNKFDGYSIEYINKNNQLLENHIVRMLKDEKGMVWFLGESGSLSYYINNKIVEYAFNSVIYGVLDNYSLIEPYSLQIKNNEIEFNIYEKGRYKIDSLGVLSTIYDLSLNINTIDMSFDNIRYFLSKSSSTLELIENNKSYLFKNLKFKGKDPILFENIRNTVYFANQNKLYYIKSGILDSLFFDNTINCI